MRAWLFQEEKLYQIPVEQFSEAEDMLWVKEEVRVIETEELTENFLPIILEKLCLYMVYVLAQEDM